jgi:hypothetical protein
MGWGFLGDIFNPAGAVIRETNMPSWMGDAQQYTDDLLNPQNRGARIIGNTLDNKTGGWEALDQIVDIPKPGAHSRGTDQGMVDYGFRKLGDNVPKNVTNTISPLVTGIAGYLKGPGAAAAAAGVMSKMQQGSDPANRDYQSGFKNAGLAAVATYAGQQAGGMMSNTGSTAPTGSEGYFQTNTSLAPTSDYTGGQYFQVDQALAPASSASSGAAGASAGYGAEYGAVPQNNYFTADQSLAPTNSIDPYADPYSYNPAVDAPQTPQDYAFLRKVIDDPRTTEVAKMAAKKALGELWNAGIAGMMGSMQTFNPQANPTPINTDYAYNAFTPTSQAAPLSEMTGLMDPNWNVRTPGISLEKPNDYMDLASYSLLKEAEKKKKEDLEKSLSGSLQPDQYSRDYYTALA